MSISELDISWVSIISPICDTVSNHHTLKVRLENLRNLQMDLIVMVDLVD
jgi:hypothetical protein